MKKFENFTGEYFVSAIYCQEGKKQSPVYYEL